MDNNFSTPRVLASDIDGTLTGDRAALDRLAAIISEQRANGSMKLFLSTGRRLDQVIEGFDKEGIPAPDAIISQVGTEIYLPPFTNNTPVVAEWNDYLHARYSRSVAVGLLEGIEGVVMQPDIFNTPLKTSCYLDKAPDPESAARRIIERATLNPAYQVVWSSGRDCDIIPAVAGKGKAVLYLVKYFGLKAEQVVVAGDSGNDRSMFDEFGCGVIVNNAQPELKTMAEQTPSPKIVLSDSKYAQGVHEGLKRLGFFN